jgi:hypothetical protein
MDKWLVEWQEVPWPLWAFEAVLLVSLVVLDATVSVSVALLVFGWFLVLAWAYLLLTGMRWLWFVTFALFALSIPGIVTGSVRWEESVLTLAGLVLLLLPAMRDFFFTRS